VLFTLVTITAVLLYYLAGGGKFLDCDGSVGVLARRKWDALLLRGGLALLGGVLLGLHLIRF
jgi:hypothetical protein